MTARYIRPVGEEGLGVSEIGGKGQSLARLASAGLPVPQGFHITTAAYDAFVAEHDLTSRITAALGNMAAGDTPDHVADSIAALFAEHKIPRQISADVVGAYHRLGSPPVAVRSSATAEDLPDASFAG